jgi:mono/diheme cytochrome c family protein
MKSHPAFVAALSVALPTAQGQTPVERGKYLAVIGDCIDCHTPGYFFGKPDMTRYLGGSDVGFEIPNLGVFVGPNLTPDTKTGLGAWSDEQIATALTTGVRPDGRILAPIMPWHALSQLTKPDLAALVGYLRSLPPVQHKVAGPFGPSEKPTVFVMKVVPPPDGAVPSEPPPKP